jgi:hypothetical protein
MTFFDLNYQSLFSRAFFGFSPKEVNIEFRANGFFTNPGFPAKIRIQQMRQSLSRQLQGAEVFLLRSIPLHGLREVEGNPLTIQF